MSITVFVSEARTDLRDELDDMVEDMLDVTAFERDALVLGATNEDGTKTMCRLPYDETQV